jgi:NAD(P)-dependent dehydrogenase (short-subunit alcohol dehydrogenase family)
MSRNAETAPGLEGKRVVVVGGTSGIGFAVAELACAQGATVVVGSRNQANVEAAIGRLPRASGQVVNLRDEASVAKFFESVGAFDHLAITAGDWDAPMFGSTRDLDLARAKDLLTVRFWGTLLAVKQACGTIARDGSITLTGGLLAQRPRQGTVMATALAGAVEYLTKGLAMDLAPLRVNAVSPGLILTDVVKQRPEATLKAMVAHQPLPRAGTPEEAAKAYVYLMLNGYATGQTLAVDGGGLLV